MDNHDEHEKKKTDHSKMDHSKMDMSKEDHSKMDHDSIPMGKAGHDHHQMMIADFKKRFWVTLVLTVPILIFSPMIQSFFGYEFLLPGNSYILFGLGTIVYFYGGWPFLKGFCIISILNIYITCAFFKTNGFFL